MAISFTQVPANALVPFTYVEIDGSQAGATTVGFRTLLIGQRLAAGSVPALAPRVIGTVTDAQAFWGANSMMAHMAEKFIRNSPVAELWGVALDDSAGATSPTVTVTATAAATSAGTIALYIAGRKLAVNIQSGNTVNQIATAINTAVGAADNLPVTSAVAGAVVTLTHRNAGLIDLDVQINYQPDESLPGGVAINIASAAGAGTPDISDALDAVGDEKFDLIVHAYPDAASLVILEDELAERWGPSLQLDGVGICSYKSANGTSAEATTFGNVRNSQYSMIVGHQLSPTPTYELSAAIAGAIAQPAANDPARPFQTLQVLGVLPPKVEQRWTHSQRNVVLSDGIATYNVDTGGQVKLERLVTTYQTSAAGVADRAFLDVNTLLTLSYIRADWRAYFSTKYGRFKLADDGTRFGPGQPVMTPSLGRAECIGRFGSWEERGLVENAEAFKAALVVERNADDSNRLDFLMRPDLINQLRVSGTQISFAL